jgi:hypothetical protein
MQSLNNIFEIFKYFMANKVVGADMSDGERIDMSSDQMISQRAFDGVYFENKRLHRL